MARACTGNIPRGFFPKKLTTKHVTKYATLEQPPGSHFLQFPGHMISSPNLPHVNTALQNGATLNFVLTVESSSLTASSCRELLLRLSGVNSCERPYWSDSSAAAPEDERLRNEGGARGTSAFLFRLSLSWSRRPIRAVLGGRSHGRRVSEINRGGFEFWYLLASLSSLDCLSFSSQMGHTYSFPSRSILLP